MTEVSHTELFAKLVEHDTRISKLGTDVHGINEKLDPIAAGVTSIAMVLKALLWMGALAAATVGVIELVERLGN